MAGPNAHRESPSTRAATPAFVMARRRAWATLACVIVGCWIGGAWDGAGSGAWFGTACGLGLAALVCPSAWWKPAGRFALLLAVVCGSAGWARSRGHEPPADRLDGVVADGTVLTLEGVVRRGPELIERPEGPGAPGAWRDDQARFELRVIGITTEGGDAAPVPARGVVGVNAPVGVMEGLRTGDRCVVSGVFRVPGGPRNPGEPDWARLGNERGMAGWLSVPDARLVGVSDRPSGLVGRFLGARSWVRDRARRALDADPTGVLNALVLGERDATFDSTYRVFQRAGVAHVLAVSGFHLALLGGFVALSVRATGERGRLEAGAVLAVVALMLFMVPARAPIVRAGVLVIALLAGDAAGRRSDRLAVLAWAGVGLLIWRPSDASGLGFLLSVGVTATLLGLAERDRGRRWSVFERVAPGLGDGAWSSARRWLKNAIRVNVSCWAIATPTIIVSTGVCSLIAPLATLVVVPLAAVLLVAGWAQAVFGVVWPTGAERTAFVAAWLADRVGAFTAWIDGFAWSSLTIVGVGWVWCGLATLGIAWCLFAARFRRAAAVLVAGCVVYAGIADVRSGRVPGLRADMIDVGDGTAVLIRSGRDALLWDCGGLHRPVGSTVADAARALGVDRVRVGVITHANLDHFNGFPDVIDRFGMETVYVTPALLASRDGVWGEVRRAIEARGVSLVALHAGDAIGLGGATGTVLWPGGAGSERWLGNDGSMVVRFAVGTDAGERSLLMCGDLQTAGVAGLLESGVEIDADVIEAPHHGSVNAAAIELVEQIGPAVVLQSTGRSRVGLDAWVEARTRSAWLSTAEWGAVFAEILPDGTIRTGGFTDTE